MNRPTFAHNTNSHPQELVLLVLVAIMLVRNWPNVYDFIRFFFAKKEWRVGAVRDFLLKLLTGAVLDVLNTLIASHIDILYILHGTCLTPFPSRDGSEQMFFFVVISLIVSNCQGGIYSWL